jgi:hypothetical protein
MHQILPEIIQASFFSVLKREKKLTENKVSAAKSVSCETILFMLNECFAVFVFCSRKFFAPR